MNKNYLIMLILVLFFLLSSCSQVSDESLNKAEFKRIEELIPSEFEDDFLLPTPNESFDIVYRIDDRKVIDLKVGFELKPYNSQIVISITISNNDYSDTYYTSITQKGRYGIINERETNLVFEEIFEVIELYIPDIMISNLTLPSLDVEGVTVTYSVDCTEIVRNRIVYTFPNTNSNCTINASVEYNNEVMSKDIEIVMSAVNELPKIPVVYINTVGNESITSNKDYVSATMNVVTDKNPRSLPLPDASLGIRLRGNSTLNMPKSSYKIKFTEKQNFLSLYEEKDWVLLANFSDQTLIRNYLAYSMSSKLRMIFTPKYTFVDVYVNGEYQGNYLLTDQIEVTNDRVNIEENVTNIDTGYLIELDKGLYRIGLENTDENYFLIDGIPFIIKSPSFNDNHYQDEHFTYIENYMNLVYITLKNQEDYSELIDDATFIDWFIISEVFKNVDAGYSSVYFYKDKGGLLKMGPVWDFDLSTGNQGHASSESRGPTGWHTSKEERNIFFYYLMKYPSFQQKLKDRWNDIYEVILLRTLDQIFYVSDSITYSRYKNFERWDIIGKNNKWYTASEIYELKTYDLQVWFLYDYLTERLTWLDREINKFD